MVAFVPVIAPTFRDEQLLNMVVIVVPDVVTSDGIFCNDEQLLNMLVKVVPAAVLRSGIVCNDEQLKNMLEKEVQPDVQLVPTTLPSFRQVENSDAADVSDDEPTNSYCSNIEWRTGDVPPTVSVVIDAPSCLMSNQHVDNPETKPACEWISCKFSDVKLSPSRIVTVMIA